MYLIHGSGDKLVTRELPSYEYIKSDSIQSQVLNHLKFRATGTVNEPVYLSLWSSWVNRVHLFVFY